MEVVREKYPVSTEGIEMKKWQIWYSNNFYPKYVNYVFYFSARLLKTVLQKVYIYSFILQYSIPVAEPVNHHGDAIDGAGGGHNGSCKSQHISLKKLIDGDGGSHDGSGMSQHKFQ